VTRNHWWWTRLAPLLAWTAFILLVSSLPSSFFFGPRTNVAGMPRRFVQYPYHVGAFLVLAILFLRCLRATDLGERLPRAELLSLLGAVVISICSELTQLWVPTRTPAARDLALDLSGALLGLGLMRVRRVGNHTR
jgi:VanZ family protein